MGKDFRREILPQVKVWKMGEYCTYFPFFKLIEWGKRSCPQPQAIYSEFP